MLAGLDVVAGEGRHHTPEAEQGQDGERSGQRSTGQPRRGNQRGDLGIRRVPAPVVQPRAAMARHPLRCLAYHRSASQVVETSAAGFLTSRRGPTAGRLDDETVAYSGQLRTRTRTNHGTTRITGGDTGSATAATAATT